MDAQARQEELKKFDESLIGLNQEQLLKIEETILKEANEADKELGKVKFDLPAKGLSNVAQHICMLLNKQTVQWQYTLGLVTMYEYWDAGKKLPKTVDYATLDSTLRTLGAMSFTGYDEWKAVVEINKYFEPLREKYSEVTDKVYYIAAKHNAIQDRLKVFEVQPEQIINE